MKICTLLVACAILAAPTFGASKPIATWTVQFDRNVGLKAEEAIWQKSEGEIRNLTQICLHRNDVVLVCRGTADTVHYREDHFAKNAIIALQRSMVGYNLGIRSGVSPDRILMGVGTVADSGLAFRTLTLEVYECTDVPPGLQDIQGVLDGVQKHLTDVDDRLGNLEQLTKYLLSLSTPRPRQLSLSLGLGATTTAYDATLYIQATLTWKQTFALDLQAGISPYTSDRSYGSETFTTRTRFLGAHGTYYLTRNGALGLTAGYERGERRNTAIGEHTGRNEGFVGGAVGRVALSQCFDLKGEAIYLLGEQYTFPNRQLQHPKDKFRLGLGITYNLGGRP